MRYLLIAAELLLAAAFFALRSESVAVDFFGRYPALYILVSFIVFAGIVDAIRRGIRLWYLHNHHFNRRVKANFDYGVDNIAKVVIVFGAVVYLFQLFGVDPRTLLTSLSIVAAAIAIITKEYINDFLVGLYFSFSQNFEIYDYVKMGEHKGKITELQILKIRLLNDDDDSILIPNSKVYNSEIINYTRRDIRLMSIDFELTTANVSTLEQLEEDLSNSLADFKEYIEPGSFNLRIVDMKKDYVELKFQYRLKKFDIEMQRQIRKKTVRQVFNQVAGGRSSAIPGGTS